jgi:hypothetical protein
MNAPRASVLKKNRTKNSNRPGDNDERQQSPAFRFLDMPPEIRNATHMTYLNNAKDIASGNDIRLKLREKIKILPRPNPSRRALFYHAPLTPAPYAVEEERLRISIQRRSSLVLEGGEGDKISDAAKDTLRDYVAAHKVAFKHHCKHDAHRAENVVAINERGKLCEDLPFLALSRRQILAEMWGRCFSTASTDPPGQFAEKVEEKTQKALSELSYKANVKNFDYLPLLREFSRCCIV